VLTLVRGHIASEYRLDASKRFSIVRQVVLELESDWLATVNAVVFDDKQLRIDAATTPTLDTDVESARQAFAAEWLDHSAFNKGVVGAMIDAAVLASHAADSAAGLTTVVAADMALELFRALTAELRRFVSLTGAHVDALIDALISRSFLPSIVHLWELTGSISASGSQMEGVLPARFRAEAAAEQRRIAAIKSRGVDARYEPSSPVDIAVDIDDRAIEFSRAVLKIRDSLNLRQPAAAPL
jgi:hypothetical protein